MRGAMGICFKVVLCLMLPLPIFLSLLVGLGLDMHLVMDVFCGVNGVV